MPPPLRAAFTAAMLASAAVSPAVGADVTPEQARAMEGQALRYHTRFVR